MEDFKPFKTCTLKKNENNVYGVACGNNLYTGFEPCDNKELAEEMAESLNESFDWEAIGAFVFTCLTIKK